MSPIIPEWHMVNGEMYLSPTATNPSNFQIPWIKTTTNSTTSVTIQLGSSTVTPGSYQGLITLYGVYDDAGLSFTTNTSFYSRNDLVAGQRYNLKVRAYSGSSATGGFGEYIYDSFTMPKISNIGSVISSTSSTTTPNTAEKDYFEYNVLDMNNTNSVKNVLDINNTKSVKALSNDSREIQRSYFKIHNKFKDISKYSVVTKNTTVPLGYKRYSFGAGILFPSSLKDPLAGGGIGFFTNSMGTNGYFIELLTDASNKDIKDRSLKVYKIIEGKKVRLEDSQDLESGKLYGGVLSSILYKMDIDVIITSASTTIVVYINNFKVTAIDKNNSENNLNPTNKIIEPTSNIALFSSVGSVAFDYVYAIPTNDNQNKNLALRGLYEGQYAKSTIDFAFGEKIAQNFNSSLEKNSYLEEFGTVAREIRYVKANFNQSAAFPLYASTGTNKFATILGSKFSNHSAEIFVMNNASSFIPLQYDQNKFFVIGNYVDVTTQHEYSETTMSDYTALEPITFQSTWIQSESDAKSLFNWIKLLWSKQQQSVNMEIFGNPAIEIGDVITINYTDNNLNGTQKFLVTNVNSSFDGGLSTSIVARSIYSQ